MRQRNGVNEMAASPAVHARADKWNRRRYDPGLSPTPCLNSRENKLASLYPTCDATDCTVMSPAPAAPRCMRLSTSTSKLLRNCQYSSGFDAIGAMP